MPDQDYDMTALHSQMAEAFAGDPDGDSRAGESSSGDLPVSEQPSTTTESPASTTTEAPAGISQKEWDAMPKAWKRDLEPQWKTLPEPVRQYAHQREKEVADGITAYKKGHDTWNTILEPHKELMEQYPDADFGAIAKATVANHVQLLRASDQDRVGLVLNLAKGYGIQPQQILAALAGSTGTEGAPGQGPAGEAFTPAQMKWIQDNLGPVAGAAQETMQFVQEQRAASTRKSIDDFFSDPKNEFVEELGQDMLRIIKEEKVPLKRAYQIALQENPEVRAKWLAKQAAAAAGNSSATKPTTTNLKSTATPASPATPGSMDDTMKSIVDKHYGASR